MQRETFDYFIGQNYSQMLEYKYMPDMSGMNGDEITNKFEEVITYLESIYTGKPTKKEKEIKEIVQTSRR